MKRRPDFLLLVMAVFGLGIIITLVVPATSTETVAAPASQLQAGVIIEK